MHIANKRTKEKYPYVEISEGISHVYNSYDNYPFLNREKGGGVALHLNLRIQSEILQGADNTLMRQLILM